jgi:nitrogen regulatory protein PII
MSAPWNERRHVSPDGPEFLKRLKKIEAVIVPSELDALRTELERCGIHAALTLTEVQQANGHRGSISGEKEPVGSLIDRLKIELIVGDSPGSKGNGCY